MRETQVLFLHHLNEKNREAVESNFDSFARLGNDILAIRDEDMKGLPSSHPVSIKGRIPRGSRRWSPDTVVLNYILENKDRLNHKRYMFCEWDCYCECDIDSYCRPYERFDVCAPYLVKKEKESGWGWFKSFNVPCEPIGFRPSTFILFSKDAVVAIAEKYLEIWGKIKDSNSEARLGSVASLLGMKIGQFDDLVFNVSWGKVRFKRNMKLYHPVKEIINSEMFLPDSKTKKFAGIWEFGRANKPKMTDLIFELDGTITNRKNNNEVYWHEEGDTISIYSGRGALTSRFRGVKADGSICFGDYYEGKLEIDNVLIKGHHWIKKIE